MKNSPRTQNKAQTDKAAKKGKQNSKANASAAQVEDKPQQARITKNGRENSLGVQANDGVEPTANKPTWRFRFPQYNLKYELLLLGIGLIAGLIATVFLLQRGAKLCELNLGPVKFALACPPTPTPPPLTCANYGIKITLPEHNTKVWQTFNVQGTFVNKPPEGSVLLMLKTPAGDYFLQKPVMIDSAQRSWQGEVVFGGNPGKYSIIVSMIGNDGRALFDYYTKVGEETKRWPAVRTLTEDMVECARVEVDNEQK